MNKLPQDLRLIVSREVKDEWDLDRILDVFRSELEARERASGSNVHTTEQLSNKFPNSKVVRNYQQMPSRSQFVRIVEWIMHLTLQDSDKRCS